MINQIVNTRSLANICGMLILRGIWPIAGTTIFAIDFVSSKKDTEMSHQPARSKLMSSCLSSCSSVPGALNYWGLHQTLHINSRLLSFVTSCLACQVSSCLFHLSMHVNPFQHLIPISSDISRPHRSHCQRTAEVFILLCVIITSCHTFVCIISLHFVNMRENRFLCETLVPFCICLIGA